MFCRMCAAHLADPAANGNPPDEAPADHVSAADATAGGALADRGSADRGEWADVTLRFAAVKAARILLSFGGDVVVTSPPEVREDLLAVAAAVTACYAAHAGAP
jgi:hypothetical protein